MYMELFETLVNENNKNKTLKESPRGSKDGVYVAELDRFGYTLTVIGRTEQEAIDALMEAYYKAYEDENGINLRTLPKEGKEDYDMYEEDREYLETAKDEMYVQFLAFGEVEWH